jgi:adenylate kinase family enzyme
MRVAVMGISGSGKSTLAKRLSAVLGVPHIELDAINWQAGWRDLNTYDPPEFARRVEAAVAQEAWVSDGNYSKIRPLVVARATHVVWLDYDRGVIMRRVISRSFVRSLTGEELWPGTGNRETWTRWFDKEHPIPWAWSNHHRRRRDYEAIFETKKPAHLVVRRLRHPREADALVAELAREAA